MDRRVAWTMAVAPFVTLVAVLRQIPLHAGEGAPMATLYAAAHAL
ncbi:MAG: hypothetical protein QOC71_1829, partial [Thermoplasmata archaeon]|nr:hypothetical protein [Thermoplasmata archaeon]